jgi:hypothetical protein
MLKLMMEGMRCLCCRHRCEMAHCWRGNDGPMPVGLEVASLMQSLCMVMAMAHKRLNWMVGVEWVCLTTDRARVGVKCSHVYWCACKLDL